MEGYIASGRQKAQMTRELVRKMCGYFTPFHSVNLLKAGIYHKWLIYTGFYFLEKVQTVINRVFL